MHQNGHHFHGMQTPQGHRQTLKSGVMLGDILGSACMGESILSAVKGAGDQLPVGFL